MHMHTHTRKSTYRQLHFSLTDATWGFRDAKAQRSGSGELALPCYRVNFIRLLSRATWKHVLKSLKICLSFGPQILGIWLKEITGHAYSDFSTRICYQHTAIKCKNGNNLTRLKRRQVNARGGSLRSQDVLQGECAGQRQQLRGSPLRERRLFLHVLHDPAFVKERE